MFELARRIFGRTVAWQALACQLMSASYFYCMSRALSNSLETALTLGALALWPWQVLFRSLSWRCSWTCVSNLFAHCLSPRHLHFAAYHIILSCFCALC